MLPRLSDIPVPASLYGDFLTELRLRGFEGDLSPGYGERILMATDNSIYQLLPQAIARVPVELPKGNSFRGGDLRIERSRTGDQRQLEKALPMRTGGHVWELQRNRDESLSGYSDSRFRVAQTPDYERVIEQNLTSFAPLLRRTYQTSRLDSQRTKREHLDPAAQGKNADVRNRPLRQQPL